MFVFPGSHVSFGSVFVLKEVYSLHQQNWVGKMLRWCSAAGALRSNAWRFRNYRSSGFRRGRQGVCVCVLFMVTVTCCEIWGIDTQILQLFGRRHIFQTIIFRICVKFWECVDRFLEYTVYCDDLILIQMYQVECLTSLSRVNSKKDGTWCGPTWLIVDLHQWSILLYYISRTLPY